MGEAGAGYFYPDSEDEAGERVVEVIPCADTPYRCDGFDPADWPPGEIPDFSVFREWERRAAEYPEGIEGPEREVEGGAG